APTDATRSRIMPVNRKWSTEELMAAVERYVRATKRKVFFEYVMLAGVNDRDEDAEALARLMKGPLYHVNLIPYNSTPDALLRGTDERRARSARRWAARSPPRADNCAPRPSRARTPPPRASCRSRPPPAREHSGSGRASL